MDNEKNILNKNWKVEIEQIDFIEVEKEDIKFKDKSCKISKIILPPLNAREKEIINPKVPPTSGIRMEIFEKNNEDLKLFMTKSAQYMFLRVFKAVSIIAMKELEKKLKEVGREEPNVLIVADDRPSAPFLTEMATRIFAYDGYNIYYQTVYDPKTGKEVNQIDMNENITGKTIKANIENINKTNNKYYSRMGTPYASAVLAIEKDIDVVIVITASHNPIIWNGVKFYIERPVPITGRIMKAVSEYAINLEEIYFIDGDCIEIEKKNFDLNNNKYIEKLVSKIIDISILKDKKVVFWPFLGKAPEIQELFYRLGVDLKVIEDDVEPPNPTLEIDQERIENKLKAEKADVAILLDADRDRIVFIVHDNKKDQYYRLSPNELYTALHNLLVKNYKQNIINVRTVPSDPRSDNSARINFITGVGYKHLGMLLFSILGHDVDEETFKSGILYGKTRESYIKFSKPKEIREFLTKQIDNNKEYLIALWEESGGHTFNFLKAKNNNGKIDFETLFAPIGDKYPAPAILLLTALILEGYNLQTAIDSSILGMRTTIDADDDRKIKIVSHFAKLKNSAFTVKDTIYKIGTFEQVDGTVDIIHFSNENTNLYLRPSGTGPSVRIYVYGPKDTAETEMNTVKEIIQQMF